MRVIPQIKASKLHTLPYPAYELSDPDLAKLAQFSKEMITFNKLLAAAKTPDEKTRIQRQIDAIDQQIDGLVYEIYGLTEKEIQIVEETTK